MKRVIELFEEICAIPHGSGNMEKIGNWCLSFAEKCGLSAERDEGGNVIIFKPGTPGFEGAPTVILQGHMDMVCQKEDGVKLDFEKEGIRPVIQGNFMTAEKTTLGADNGIAVAMVLAILERDDLRHPPLEAVFTTDEEIGMIGAKKLDMTKLQGRKMINLDSEEDDAVTVSCAGGSDFIIRCLMEQSVQKGTVIRLCLKGLLGGHSGVEIQKGRVNAATLLGSFLHHMLAFTPFSVLSLHSGDKGNAIPFRADATLLVSDADAFLKEAGEYLELLKEDISPREPGFSYQLEKEGVAEENAFTPQCTERIVSFLAASPTGVVEMSRSIPGLVETSLNLGILQSSEKEVTLHFTLRSNTRFSLFALEEKMRAFASLVPCSVEAFGHYPPWEYRENSPLREQYERLYQKIYGEKAKVEAIHAGLECGVFAAGIPDLDCIAIGPTLLDVHTTSERMSLSSLQKTYTLLQNLLEEIQ